MIQQELDELRDRFNNHTGRKVKGKILPSGVSPNIAFALPDQYGGENHLQPVDRDAVRSLMDSIGGEELIRFVSAEYAIQAQGIFDSLGVRKLTMHNVWDVFEDMLPLIPSV